MVQDMVENKIYNNIADAAIETSDLMLMYFQVGNSEQASSAFYDDMSDNASFDDFMIEIEAYLQEYGVLKNSEIVGYHTDKSNDFVSRNIVRELTFERGILLYSCQMTRIEESYKVLRTDFEPIETSLVNSSKFNLLNKSWRAYLMLTIGIITLLFSLITAAVCFGTVTEKRIRWTILCLVGIGVFHFNWFTSLTDFNILAIGLPPFGLERSATLNPIILTLRLPIGAVLYWMFKHGKVTKTLDDILEPLDVD